ncbi:hypothetical protein Tco_0487582 [Tanacetum coccineum]
MVESHGEYVESHPHIEELSNQVTSLERLNTYRPYNESHPVFVLTGTSFTRKTTILHPPMRFQQVPWSNELPLEKKELNAIIGTWFTLWRD